MPELFGIVDFSQSKTKIQVEFERLKNGFQGVYATKPITQISEGIAFGIIEYHDNDKGSMLPATKDGVVGAWVGRYPSGNIDEISLKILAGGGSNAIQAFLSEMPPPFAGCVADCNSQLFYIFGDCYGFQPIYYSCTSGALIFSTKLGPLLRSGLADWRLDRSALLDFFTYEHVTGNRTFADSVQLLPPASLLCFQNGAIQLSTYADCYSGKPDNHLKTRDIADQLYGELSKSVSESCDLSSRFSITLSGGLDSRALLGCASASGKEVHNTYTFGKTGCPEFLIAQELANRAGVPHQNSFIDGSFLPKWIDHAVEVTGGMVGAIHFHILALLDQLAPDEECILDGLGGDALTGAHLSWGMVMANSREQAMDLVYKQRATVFANRKDREFIFEPDFLQDTSYDSREAICKHFTKLDDAPIWVGCHRFDLLERQRRFIQFGPHLMRPFLAVHTPFYSPDLVGLMTKAPAKALIEQHAYLLMHAKHIANLAEVPDDKRGLPVGWPQSIRFAKRVFDFSRRRLPSPIQNILMKEQMTSTNYAKWFRDDLRGFIEERLLDDIGVFDGIIRKEIIEQTVIEHQSGDYNHSNRIGCFLSLGAWLNSVK